MRAAGTTVCSHVNAEKAISDPKMIRYPSDRADRVGTCARLTRSPVAMLAPSTATPPAIICMADDKLAHCGRPPRCVYIIPTANRYAPAKTMPEKQKPECRLNDL